MNVWGYILNLFPNLGSLIWGWLLSLLPWWAAYFIMGIINIVVILLFVISVVIVLIWVERRGVGRFQIRIGPNRAGPQGIFQPFADVIKLFLKEDVVPALCDKWVHWLAPVVVFIPTLLAFAVIPLQEGAILADLNIGILYIVAISTLTGIGIFMAGWASSNKYALIASMRAVAQIVSYEIPVVLSIIGVVMIAGTLSMAGIVQAQSSLPLILLQPLGCLIYFIGATAELNRSPMDLLEAESEIVAGYNIEYSSMKWGLFFLGEFAAAILVSAIIATLFLGGWQGPWLPPYAWFIIKTFIVYFVLLWMRSTLPRLRVDQLMGFAWKFLFPLSLINIFITGIELILWPSLPWPVALVNIGLALGLVIGWSRLFRLGAGEYGEWGFGLGLAKGMVLTFIHLFRKPITLQYPEERFDLPDRFRGYEFGWDPQRCTACQLCVNACPHGVIEMTIGVDEKKKRRVEKLEMDLGRCMFCGLCIEACNRQALTMGKGYETATYRRGELIKDMSKLSEGVGEPSAYARAKKAAEPGKEGEEE